MATVERIQELLDSAVYIPIKDGAGIIIPAGLDAAIRAKAIQDCLKIVKANSIKEESNDI